MPVIPSGNPNYSPTQTVRDVIQKAMKKLGVLQSGESASADELADGLDSLNLLLDSWNTEGLSLYAMERQTVSWAAGVASKTIGENGDIDIARPLDIPYAGWIPSSGSEYAIDIVTVKEWADLANKTASGPPSELWYVSTHPLGTVYLSAIPDQDGTLTLYLPTQLAQLEDVNATLALPQGYARAVIANLAIEMAPDYGKSVSVELAGQAAESKINIQRANSKPLTMCADDAMLGGGSWDINSGRFL